MKKNTGNDRSNRRTSLKSCLINTVLVLLVLTGLLLIVFYQLRIAVQEQNVLQEVQAFRELVPVYKTEELPLAETESAAPMHYKELYEAMQCYNQEIFRNDQCQLVDNWSYQSEVLDLTSYGYALDAVGLVRIPDIDVEMPLYLGASNDNLAKGFAQFSQTSMPIGGENTNCVIAGHRGWNGMAYLRDVELLEIGDPIYIQNPWDVLEYHIREILLIEPDDMRYIYIQEGQDLLTVVTCHPYGVGSHRYVLICERYLEEETVVPSPTEGYWTWEWQTGVTISAFHESQPGSSKLDIFKIKYLPWICAVLSAAFVSLILFVCSITKKKPKNKKPGKYCASKKHRS